ncbi:hypothetical protein LUZ60_005819 [Juncus effusus]|nr:hypothetical protein LUZ60_005819 [Juncus effusus]
MSCFQGVLDREKQRCSLAKGSIAHLEFRMVPSKLYIRNPLVALFFAVLVSPQVYADYVNITLIQNAVPKGAVCLDGSPPAYHLSVGFGSGINNWLVHIEGGGWCNNVTTCLERKHTYLGSSTYMAKQVDFTGILSSNENSNPDFYNWNKVKVRYCDGASFTGDVKTVDPATKLHYRGARIWQAVMQELLARGMDKAENALLSGCSSGGLTTILHCDNFRALLPSHAHVKCLSDAGFFVNERDISGKEHIAAYYNDVITTHGSANNLPLSCTAGVSPSLCFFPQYVAKQIKTPLFILNSAIDAWQIANILVPDSADPNATCVNCKADIAQCSSLQLEIIQGFRDRFVKAIDEMGKSISRGLFINSCFCHCQSESQETWLASRSPMLANTRIANAVGDWYFDRSQFKEIDCPYPCDSTCVNHVDISSA